MLRYHVNREKEPGTLQKFYSFYKALDEFFEDKGKKQCNKEAYHYLISNANTKFQNYALHKFKALRKLEEMWMLPSLSVYDITWIKSIKLELLHHLSQDPVRKQKADFWRKLLEMRCRVLNLSHITSDSKFYTELWEIKKFLQETENLQGIGEKYATLRNFVLCDYMNAERNATVKARLFNESEIKQRQIVEPSNHKRDYEPQESNNPLYPDILKLIFRMIPMHEGNWFNCMLVCKDWNEMGREVFDPSIPNSNICGQLPVTFLSVVGNIDGLKRVMQDNRIEIVDLNGMYDFCPSSSMSKEILQFLLEHPKVKSVDALTASLMIREKDWDAHMILLKSSKTEFHHQTIKVLMSLGYSEQLLDLLESRGVFWGNDPIEAIMSKESAAIRRVTSRYSGLWDVGKWKSVLELAASKCSEDDFHFIREKIPFWMLVSVGVKSIFEKIGKQYRRKVLGYYY